MLIGLEKRFVFIANSKAASTSVERVLAPFSEIIVAGTPQRKHLTLREAIVAYDFLFGQPGYRPESFFKFGVLRDPVEWIHSWFRYRKGNKVESPLPAAMDFAGFWALDDWNKFLAPGRKRLQRDFFIDAEGRVIADFLIPYHDLDAQFAAVCDRLGVKRPLPRENVSRLAPEEEPIPPALLEELRDFYAEDYDLLARLPKINAAAPPAPARRAGPRKQGTPR
jgi:hypothetical protein